MLTQKALYVVESLRIQWPSSWGEVNPPRDEPSTRDAAPQRNSPVVAPYAVGDGVCARYHPARCDDEFEDLSILREAHVVGGHCK